MTDDHSKVLTWRWLAGVLVGIVVILVGSWAGSLQLSDARQNEKIEQQRERQAIAENRISLVEQRFGFIDQRLVEILTVLEKHRQDERRR